MVLVTAVYVDMVLEAAVNSSGGGWGLSWGLAALIFFRT